MTTDNSDQSNKDDPVGTGDYMVQEGDCIASISFDNGHYWKTVWNDSGNADLKQKRQSPFLLLPGDRVTIPPITPKDDPAQAELQHKYLLKGVPAIVQIKILEVPTPPPPTSAPDAQKSQEGVEYVIKDPEADFTPPKPAAKIPYDLVIDGAVGPSGNTDSNGLIKIRIMPNAKELLIRLEPGTARERSLSIFLGGLNPLNSSSGQAQRLANLAYNIDPANYAASDLEQALELFQKQHDLNPTGNPDQTTLDKLKQFHGS